MPKISKDPKGPNNPKKRNKLNRPNLQRRLDNNLSKDFNDRYSLIVNTFPAGMLGHYRFFQGIKLEIK